MTEQKKNTTQNEKDLEKVTGGAGTEEQTPPQEEPDYPPSPKIPERNKKISEF